MTQTVTETETQAPNPLDVVEELVVANDWAFQRSGDDELMVEIGGRWGDYRLFFVWQEDAGALQFCCRLDVRVPTARRSAVAELLAHVNERLWVGHFDIGQEEATLLFRHTALLRGMPCASPELIEDLVEIAVAEAERYYPSFQLVIWGGSTAEDAIRAAILHPVGEA